MIKLEEYKRLFRTKEFLKTKNRWPMVPPHILKFLEDNEHKIVALCNNPDRINRSIRHAITVEYSSLEDLMSDMEFYDEIGIVNMLPGNILMKDPDSVKISRKTKCIRMVFQPIKNSDLTEIRCVGEVEKKVDEEDFLNNMMNGKLPGM